MYRWLGRMAYAAATLSLGEYEVFQFLREARVVHRLGGDELAARQNAALGRLLAHAAAGSSYYRKLIPANDTSPARARLAAIPLLEKTTLQSNAEELRIVSFRGRLIAKSTGGSTGAPVQIIKDASGVAREMATTWAALERYGVRLGDRSARFWGTPLTAARRLKFKVTDAAMNRVRLSAFDLDEQDLSRYWARCKSFRPRWLYGYASLIHLFAEWIERNGHIGTSLGIVAVVPTSEPLSAAQRQTIARVFGAPVYDEYGCGEVGAIAYGCERGRLHVMTDNVIVEILGPDGEIVPPGDVGEVVITDLTNMAMPIIRYRLGDRARRGTTCDCGQAFPVIENIAGRIHDVVFTPAGRRWHGEKIDYLMSQLFQAVGGFRQYQVVQHSALDLEFRLVAEGPIPDELSRRIADYVHERLDGMRATVTRVDRIERSASGKLRLVRNEWSPPELQPH